MVGINVDRVSALMLANGQHGCWSLAALPLPSGMCETRGAFSSFELAGGEAHSIALPLDRLSGCGGLAFCLLPDSFLQQG